MTNRSNQLAMRADLAAGQGGALTLALKPILPVSRIEPRSDGVTYDRGHCVYQLLRTHGLRVQANQGPIHHYPLALTLKGRFGEYFQCLKLNGGDVRLDFYRVVFGEFWRRTYDKTFQHWKMDRNLDKPVKEFVRLEAETWIAVVECLKALNEKGAWQFDWPCIDFGAALGKLIDEAFLLSWCMDFTDHTNAQEIRNQQQSVNASLKRRENSFDQGTFSYEFIATCLPLLDSYTNLETAWERLLAAKSKQLENWRKHQPTAYDSHTRQIADPKIKAVAKKERQLKYTRRKSV
jgi:hypothetical protein